MSHDAHDDENKTGFKTFLYISIHTFSAQVHLSSLILIEMLLQLDWGLQFVNMANWP